MSLHPETYAVMAERRRDWPAAAHHWRAAGRPADAAACEMIADALTRGDAWRALSANLRAGGMSFEDAVAKATAEIYTAPPVDPASGANVP